MKDLDAISPDWGILDWTLYKYIPMNTRVAIPNMARGCPFTCSFCSQWKFWRDYRVRDPKKVVDEIEELVNKYQVGFFILADEEPTINRKKFIQFCEELIARGLNKKVQWGINTRVTDILRDEQLLKFYNEAGLMHVSLGTEAAAQLKLDLFNKETKISDNKKAIRLLREAGIVVEAQFIVGLDNETAGDAGRNLSHGDGLEAGPRQLVDVHPLAVHPAVQGTERQGRGVRLRQVQLRHADPEAGGDGARRVARPGDEQLSPVLHVQGVLLVSLVGVRTCGGAICSAV